MSSLPVPLSGGGLPQFRGGPGPARGGDTTTAQIGQSANPQFLVFVKWVQNCGLEIYPRLRPGASAGPGEPGAVPSVLPAAAERHGPLSAASSDPDNLRTLTAMSHTSTGRPESALRARRRRTTRLN